MIHFQPWFGKVGGWMEGGQKLPKGFEITVEQNMLNNLAWEDLKYKNKFTIINYTHISQVPPN